MEAEKSEKKKEKENESKMVSNSLEIMTQNSVEKIIECDFSSYFSSDPLKNICGITYYRIGNTYGFLLNSLSYPRCIIGPHWYFFIIMLIIITLITSFLYLKFLVYALNTATTILFFCLIGALVLVYSINVIINPGIAMNQVRNNLEEQYCTICKTYIKQNSNSFHCNLCNVCIEGFDHHCVWIGKCVGRKNKIWFYGLIGTVTVFYAFLVSAIVHYYWTHKK